VSERKLSERDRRRIVNEASNSTLSCAKIKANLDLHVSRTTVWRALKESSTIQRSKMRAGPLLLERHISARLEFGRLNISTDWTMVRNHSKTNEKFCFSIISLKKN